MSKQVDNWNDELAGGMKEGFAKLEREMKAGFEKSDQRLEKAIEKLGEQIKESEGRLEARMDRLESRRARFQGWIWGVLGTAFGALVGHFV